jgi:CelD/BcsL family acetyltransferase involved in cellulose biosynthesis
VAESVYIPTTTSWDKFWNSLHSRRRNDFRRARKKAELEGNVTVKVFCPGQEDLRMHLEQAFTIEAAGWKGRQGSAISTREELRLFFETYASLACKSGKLRLCFLCISDEPVAMQIGVVHANRFWVLKIGYDERWNRCSPGLQLAYETMRHMFDCGMDSYEWLGTNEDWLHAWPLEKHECVSVALYPLRPLGLIGLGMDFTHFVRKRIEKKVK